MQLVQSLQLVGNRKVTVTDAGLLSDLKAISDKASLTYTDVKDSVTNLTGSNKSLATGKKVEITDATVSADNYDTIVTSVGGSGEVKGKVVDDIANLIDGHDLKGATDVIANVTADNQDISALTLDSEIKKIDLMGKKGVIFDIANVRTGGVNKTIQDTTTGGTFKFKDTGSALSADAATIALIKNQTVVVSDKVDMDTLKEISDSATTAKTTATLLEDTATKLKDNKTLIAGTSGAKTVTLSSGTTTPQFSMKFN